MFYDNNTGYVKTNTSDNPSYGGNVLYSKNTDIEYVPGSYSTIARGNASNPFYVSSRYSKVNSGMYVKYNTNTHLAFSFGIKNGKYKCIPAPKATINTGTSDVISNP